MIDARLDEAPRAGPVPRLELESWRAAYGLVAGVTGRGAGFNLGLFSDEPRAQVTARWEALFGEMRPGFRGFAVGRQVHARRLATHGPTLAGWQVLDGVDGHLTAHPGVLLFVTVADCVPIYLAHPDSGAVALLHAGWRGIAAGMLETGVSALCDLTKSVESAIVMHCGVAICGTCYEVGSEVHAAVRHVAEPARGPLDLRAELLARAGRLGIRQATASGWCTAHHRDRFFSHRASGGVDGRMVAYLGRPLS
ncbi:MAG: polyphenol oxidase family protein [Gemmatimonadota bacterium]|nr:polyphenol oxidase family protein [Gemmatimonadota bacterium]